MFFDDTDHGHDIDTSSTVDPPEQDPDIPAEYEDQVAEPGMFAAGTPTEQDELDQLDTDYREVD